MIQKHIAQGEKIDEFISEVKRLEPFHIVLSEENDVLKKEDISADYTKAGIELIQWSDIPEQNKKHLLQELTCQVANKNQFMN